MLESSAPRTKPYAIKHSDKLLESTVERRPQRLNLLVEVNGGLGTLSNALGGELKLL